ncbi:hypothetical protein [Vulgatibacter incomptus]|uniref:Uncharacterized protein n=1 Tax=Vulgatibacter incomptus TaxID=1391653 RepID=A0A0K1PG70_9BACT|nr:hypothetical protein [Vulgatibacter incomptus]AKU92416.1 hypothetical protein AKJ08_2803 [Vulgatibacter incomptus]
MVATDIEVAVRTCPGTGAPEFHNDFRVEARGSARTLHLPALYADDRRWIVFELPFAQPTDPRHGLTTVADVEALNRGP